MTWTPEQQATAKARERAATKAPWLTTYEDTPREEGGFPTTLGPFGLLDHDDEGTALQVDADANFVTGARNDEADKLVEIERLHEENGLFRRSLSAIVKESGNAPDERAQDASYWRSYSGCATPGELRLQLHQIAEALGCVGSEGLEAAARRVAGERDAARAISRGAEERIASANAETLRISADAQQIADRAKVLARASGDVLDLRDHAEAGTSLWDAIGKLEVAGIVGGTDIVAAMRAAKRAVEAENNALRARVAELEANKGEEKTAAVPCVFDASLFPDGYDERTVAAEARTEESSEPQ